MRKVKKNYTKKPFSLQPSGGPYKNALKRVIDAGRWGADATSLYSSPSILISLNDIYKNKCAYCEQTPLGSPLQVEHFRPKNGVDGIAHTGYYWLGYEWSNLLLSCGNCNSNKGNHFELLDEKNRIIAPIFKVNKEVDQDTFHILYKGLRDEKCLLINPEIDDPNLHFKYLTSGYINPTTDNGIESEKRYSLNRDELFVNGRQKIVNELTRKILKRIDLYKNGKPIREVLDSLILLIEEEIIENLEVDKPFCTFYKHMLLNHNSYFIDSIGEVKYRAAVKMAFNKSIKKLLQLNGI
ncbi:MAG TPA: HNH endonuclease [Chitinophagaceae bacterium]|nr:HNH endonuclease [Chitinophagaceae bacterium]